MNVFKLRKLLLEFNGSVSWVTNGLVFKVEYFEGVGYLNKPRLFIEGKPVGMRHAFSCACTIFREFRTLLSIEQFNQIKVLMFIDNIYSIPGKESTNNGLYEVLRFDEEVITKASVVMLISKIAR